MTQRLWTIPLLLLLVTSCSTTQSQKEPDPLAVWVDPAAQVALERGTRKEPFTTLTKALERADDGTRIYLAPGTYRINMNLDRPLTLAADEEKRRLAGGGQLPIPVLAAADASLPVLAIGTEGRLMVKNLELRGGSAGIALARGGTLAAENSRLTHNTGAGLLCTGEEGDPAIVTLKKCEILNNGETGLQLGGNQAQVIQCVIQDNQGAGILLGPEAATSVVASVIQSNRESGIEAALGRHSRLNLIQNTIKGNQADGIRLLHGGGWLWSDPTVRIQDNTMDGNGRFGLACVDPESAEVNDALDFDGITLENNQYAGNRRALAGGIEPQ